MNPIILMTAMTATSGLFGGGRQCTTGQCGRAYAAPVRSYAATCQTGSCGGYVAAPAPQYHRVAAPAPQVATVAAPQAVAAPAPRYFTVQSYYYAPASTCPNGTCPRR
jgi:hypothetical protein